MDEDKRFKACPHCGEPIHEHAVFCPHCARSLQPRAEAKPPRLWRKLLLPVLAALAVLAVLTAGLLYWQANRPQVYDNGGAEVIYTDQDVTYQVLVGWMDDRFSPGSYLRQPIKSKYRKPGTGCVTQISDHLWEGRYSPKVNGKRIARNIYATTEAECEEKLAWKSSRCIARKNDWWYDL